MQLWTKTTEQECKDGTKLSPGDCCPDGGYPIGCFSYRRAGDECTYGDCSPQYKLKLKLSTAERSEFLGEF